jgi:23S rRNA pseudouridine2604 synthase
MSEAGISINKFVSSTGYCSRREADDLIEQGRVYVNGRVATKAMRIDFDDKVTIDGEVIKNSSKPVIIALNKPVGITSTTDPKDRSNIIDFVDHKERIFPIGRLDKDSSGLILLTNRGDLVNKILRQENNHEKEYVVYVKRAISREFLKSLAKGVYILGTKTKPCKTYPLSKYSFGIVLTQGLNRQIRRMCSHFGYRVSELHRIRIMNIQLGKLKPGQWRNLNAFELQELEAKLK